jgi:hypothetical protein
MQAKALLQKYILIEKVIDNYKLKIMNAFLSDNSPLQNVWIVFLSKSRKLFNWLTGYDLMFEASRRDVEPAGSERNGQAADEGALTGYSWPTFNGAKKALRKIQINFGVHGQERAKTLAPGRA